MTTDYHALCAELLNAWDNMDRARTALAQPEPPTRPACFEFAMSFLMSFLGDPEEAELRSYIEALEARAALTQPVPVGPTDLRDETLLNEADACFLYGDGKYTAFPEEVVAFARRILLAGQRWGRPTPTPIPVSERLPEPEDCDADGFCWWFSAADPMRGTFGVGACWVLRKHEPDDDDWRTHWLPAHALPLPAAPGEGE